MSVVDSREDLEAAKTRLAAATPEELAADLQFWAVAETDARDDHVRLSEEQGAVIRRFQEAGEWRALIANELRSRRDARLADRPPAQD